MRDAFFVLPLCAALATSGCAGRPGTQTLSPRDASEADRGAAGLRAHLVLAEAAPPQSMQKDPPTTIDHHAQGDGRAFGWFSLGVGVLGAGVAITTSAMMLHQKSKRDSDCDAAKICSSDGLNANTQLTALSGWNIGSYVVAAAGIGIGAFLLITNPSDSEKQTAIGVAPTGSGAGLNLRSTF